MAKNRSNTIPVLIDIRYKFASNRFEEVFGDNINYADIEQESYIDLKAMVFEKISKNIKFRKFFREKNTLILKADMLEKEYKLLLDINEGKIIDHKKTNDKKKNPTGEIIKEKFDFLHDFIISNIKIMTEADLLKSKKTFPAEES